LPNPVGFLDDRFSNGLAGTLADDIRFGGAHRLAVRVSEMNTVACGGPASLVQSFATALWAPDALFEMAKAGVASVNWHIRAAMTNAPVAFGTNGMSARPELFGLALYSRMIGPAADLLNVAFDSPQKGIVKAWAIRSRGHVRILLIDKSAQSISARIARPGGLSRSVGSLIRLLAPSVGARRGVTLAGQTIGPDGRWQGRRIVQTVRPQGGSYRVVVAGYSAVLIDLG
jgi:hypothetical protein